MRVHYCLHVPHNNKTSSTLYMYLRRDAVARWMQLIVEMPRTEDTLITNTIWLLAGMSQRYTDEYCGRKLLLPPRRMEGYVCSSQITLPCTDDVRKYLEVMIYREISNVKSKISAWLSSIFDTWLME